MKQVFSSLCAIAALVVTFGAFSYALGQTPSATPDPFVVQLTSSPTGFSSFAGDITANGRFVVFESNGDLDTQSRKNADGNREIFLADYAQRRIFQLTNTINVPKPPASPTPTPSPSPSPTPTPNPTPADPAQTQIEISNNHPMISLEPPLVAGTRIYTIVFSSNAPNPSTLDPVDAAGSAAVDGNQEIWIYRLPPVSDVNLSSGDDQPFVNLAGGTFQRITITPSSRPLRTGINPPDVVDDNREAAISDDGITLAFISTRDLVPSPGNADANPELFFCRSTGGFASGTNTYTQATNTQNHTVGAKTFSRFQQNPSLSASGGTVAFISTADLASNNNDDGATHGNAEIYVADFTGSGLGSIRQITKTKAETTGSNTGATVNLLSPGRRLSRDGAFVTYESRAEDPTANSATNIGFMAVFVSTVSSGAFSQAGPRGLVSPGDIIRFPTFTDYDPTSLAPGTVVFASALNFKADGTFPAVDQDTTGLNPPRVPQLFATQVSSSPARTFRRMTKNPASGGLRASASSTLKRIAFSLGGAELGGGNSDNSVEVFYLLTPDVTSDSTAALSFFTGASNFPVATATPSASPTPAPTPTPGTIAIGLAQGELSIVRSTVALGPSPDKSAGGSFSETTHSPILPVELNGVLVSVNGAAAGLYFVGDSASEGINFVVPIGVPAGVATVVVNNNGTVFRGFVQIVASQPDIFTSTNAAGGIAMVCNVTNTAASGCITGPFKVMSADSTGTLVPTVLEIWLTGVRGVIASEAKVTIGTTDITPTSVRRNTGFFGNDLITITLPSTLTPGDYPLIVTVTKGGGTFSSREATTAARITIIP